MAAQVARMKLGSEGPFPLLAPLYSFWAPAGEEQLRFPLSPHACGFPATPAPPEEPQPCLRDHRWLGPSRLGPPGCLGPDGVLSGVGVAWVVSHEGLGMLRHLFTTLPAP